ncbi:hypothetical protein FISHEDRAFT_76240 [Fistulina hepatica ATCC 64428]|uniref:Uncharacterized protein n=1 Tax=Fistulina hepatica ATCC 64428 TaxID=1128425 RepID=A0A0D7A4L7_9AGAR|nr:hypothetical protein FISHEDRAFT_76240 [Fistulina hepatica ATCC 64428]
MPSVAPATEPATGTEPTFSSGRSRRTHLSDTVTKCKNRAIEQRKGTNATTCFSFALHPVEGQQGPPLEEDLDWPALEDDALGTSITRELAACKATQSTPSKRPSDPSEPDSLAKRTKVDASNFRDNLLGFRPSPTFPFIMFETRGAGWHSTLQVMCTTTSNSSLPIVEVLPRSKKELMSILIYDLEALEKWLDRDDTITYSQWMDAIVHRATFESLRDQQRPNGLLYHADRSFT